MFCAVVLAGLIDEERPWAIEELVHETGEPLGTLDALAELERASLAHKVDERFICASRAALKAAEPQRGEA